MSLNQKLTPQIEVAKAGDDIISWGLACEMAEREALRIALTKIRQCCGVYARAMPRTDNGRAMVSLCQPFSGDEGARIVHVLQKLGAHNTHHWAFTGSLALEFHLAQVGAAPRKRRFTDLDFVVDSFDSIPVGLSAHFLFNHVHRTAGQGKLCIQLVEPEAKVRIDVFRTSGETMSRTVNILCDEGRFRMLALEDLAARCSGVALGVLSGSVAKL